jgi:hypothetical protein
MIHSQDAQILPTHLFHSSLHHHLSSSLADLTASLHSFIVFIISFIPITAMASSMRMTSIQSLDVKVHSRVQFPSFGFGTHLVILIRSQVRFPSLGFRTRLGNQCFTLLHSFILYIPHHPLVPSSHTIPISPNLIPPCSYLSDPSCL